MAVCNEWKSIKNEYHYHLTKKLGNSSKLIETIKSKLIGTQYEWDSTIDNVLRVFDKNLKYYLPKNILDVGCGRGDRTVHIANYFNVNTNNVYGLDYSNDFLNYISLPFSFKKTLINFLISSK